MIEGTVRMKDLRLYREIKKRKMTSLRANNIENYYAGAAVQPVFLFITNRHTLLGDIQSSRSGPRRGESLLYLEILRIGDPNTPGIKVARGSTKEAPAFVWVDFCSG